MTMTTTTLNRKQALDLIVGTNGRFFVTEFVKRSDGSLRVMHCRTGVKRHVKGPLQRDWDGTPVTTLHDGRHDLVQVWDVDKKGYRSIPIEGLRKLKVDGVEYTIE